MKHKVDELEGDLLARAVAMAQGWRVILDGEYQGAGWICIEPNGAVHSFGECGYRPDFRWEHGGPIIEANPWLLPFKTGGARMHIGLYGSRTPGGFEHNGPAPLVAAMRAYVAAEFGKEVEL
jgi:hypothetical protein